MKQEPQIILCPYCGHVQTVPENAAVPDQCDECKGLFEPLSRRATQISMGPWYIRDKKNPFRPGCSYEVLSKMARNNRIKPTTVVRGPSTKQFWSVARNVPGIAHLLGYCHQCSAKVQPTDAACHACGAKFEEPKERNELGLAYRTAQEASAAQRALEKEIAAITGASVSPGGSGISRAVQPSAPGAGLLDEVLGSGGRFGGSPLLNFSSQPAAAGASTIAPTPPRLSTMAPPPRPMGAAAGPAAQPGFAAGFKSAPMPAAARAVDAFSLGGETDDTGIDEVQRKQRAASTMTWALIGFNALLIIVVIAFVILNKGKPADSQPRNDNPAKDSGDAPANSSKNSNTNKANPAIAANDNNGKLKPTPIKPPPADPTTDSADVSPALPSVDPLIDAAAKSKLVEARALADLGDLASALPLLIEVRDKFPKATHPPDLALRIDEFTAELERRNAVAEDKEKYEEVISLLATAKDLHRKNDYQGEVEMLKHVRDTYEERFHPRDLAKQIALILKAIERKEKATFFGFPTE